MRMAVECSSVKGKGEGRRMDRLQAFEAMLGEIQERYASEKEALDKLQAQGKERTATYRQYMANRLLYGRMLDLYEQHGLLTRQLP